MEKLNFNLYGITLEQPYDPIAFGKMKANSYNQTEGDLSGMDCKKCLNRGRIAHAKEDGSLAFTECDCMRARRSIWKMEKSGLKNVIKEMTFERFRTTEAWQENIKARAMAYAESLEGWLLFCGQVGSGKTHLCTAVCRHRLLKGDEVRYMPWRDDVAKLKAFSLDNEERGKLIEDLKTAQILYIDDLFKTGKAADGSDNPTSADVNIAFEIINYRYINHLPTIVSTEKTPQELLAIDEATASRIIERAKANTLNISRKENRNYRLRDVIEV